MVQNYFSVPAFEPLNGRFVENLTKKALFLLIVASGKRRGSWNSQSAVVVRVTTSMAFKTAFLEQVLELWAGRIIMLQLDTSGHWSSFI